MSLFCKESLSHVPWSLSKAQSAIRCPFSFRRKYVDKVKGKPSPGQAANRIGKAAHVALEWLLQEKHDLREAMRRAAIKEKLTSIEMDELYALAHNINGFLQRIGKFKQEQGVTEQAVEKKFGLTCELQPCDFWDTKTVFFRGVWDLCLRVQDKYLVIIDHKTGEDKGLDAYEDQLKMYAIAGLHVFPGISRVQAALNYIETEEGVTWDKPYPADVIRAKLVPWFSGMIHDATQAAETSVAKKGWWCKFCEYTEVCPLR